MEVADAGLGSCRVGGVIQMIASNDTYTWPVLALYEADLRTLGKSTRDLFLRTFEEVRVDQFTAALREQLGISRRSGSVPKVYQSRTVASNAAPGQMNPIGALEITWRVKDLLGLRTTEQFDAFFVPSLYNERLVIMPPSLCRYAIAFYASSLVRYRPYVFDSERYPEQAYMFDAIARKCALPMLIDTLCGLEGRDYWFYASDAMRI